jgi:gas vesicle protein
VDKNNKLWKRMMIGAAIGAAISLFDRETRKTLAENTKHVKKKLEYLINEPVNVAERINKQMHEYRQSLEQLLDDLSFIVGKIKEIKEKTPEVIEFFKETKETFLQRKDK